VDECRINQAVADRIAVMSAGELQQVGTIRELIDRPHNRLVAEFVGEPPISIFENIDVIDNSLQLGDFSIKLPNELQVACLKHTPASVGIRPGDFTIGNADAKGMSGIVKSVQPMGEWSVVLCDTHIGAANIVVPTLQRPIVGTNIRLLPDLGHLHLFAQDGRNIVLMER
jgi:ABC-type sugar transport system ATPase subunit